MKNWQGGVIVAQAAAIVVLVGLVGVLVVQRPTTATASTGVGASAAPKKVVPPPLTAAEMARADQAARMNSAFSTLQTLRGQTELYKIQHNDQPPPQDQFWEKLSSCTDSAHNVLPPETKNARGPYVVHPAVNPLNGQSAVGTHASVNVGWVYTVQKGDYVIQAVNTNGTDVLPN